MLGRRKSGGDGMELRAAYAPAKARRKRQEKHAAAADARCPPLPQANAMFMATVAPLAPPHERSTSTSTRSILQSARTVKPAMNQYIDPRLGSSAKNQYDSGRVIEVFDEREETPRRNELMEMPLKEKLMQESSAFIQEKLLYDELLRSQRSRAEDMTKLFGFALLEKGCEYAKKTEGNTFRRAAGFREEWRIGRETEILDGLKFEEEQMSNNADETKNQILRDHFKRSIHMFLVTDLSRVPNVDPTRSTQTKRSQDLLYAQQMDRVLSGIETQQPFVVMTQAILEARSRFQSLLSRDPPLWNVQNRCEPVPVESCPSSENVRIEETARPELLQLYENVMDAKHVVKSTAVKTKMSSKSSTVAVLQEESNPKFLADLQQQRAEVEHQQNEIQARDHLRFVFVKRVQRSYRKYREQEWQRKKTETLERIAKAQATRVLQLRIPILYRRYRFLRSAKLALLRKHQGARVAIFCFWKHVYWRRCGFEGFRFVRDVNEVLLISVIRIQSFARQVRARREVHHKRSIVALRSRRARAKDWRTLHSFGMHVKPFDIDLVEWRCRISIEKMRVRGEIAREESRFVLEWKKYKSKLQKEVMKSKLPSEWIPQIDQISGEEYFLNTKTAKTLKEHPNKVLFNQLTSKQRTRAEEIYADQIKRLEDYPQRLDEQLQEHLRGSLDEILAGMISSRVNI